MNFINSYKMLEKLCNDIYKNNHGISEYIDEMLDTPRGSYLVYGWDDDLKQLKHYRWMRNKIAHEPDCSEENMCSPEDEEWLRRFYSRIINQTDPLAMYHKKIKLQPAAKSVENSQPIQSQYTYPAKYNRPNKTSNFLIGFIVLIIAIIFAAVLALKYFLT